MDLSDRITIRVTDQYGRGLPNFEVKVSANLTGEVLLETWSGYDGNFRFFPAFDGLGQNTLLDITVCDPNDPDTSDVFTMNLYNLTDDRTIEIELSEATFRTPSVLEVCFVIDTTGSMSDELNYITREFETIISNINTTFQVDEMRFSLVVYRDLGDEYVVRDYDFTSSIKDMKKTLSDQYSSGGGDYPEAMHLALKKSDELDWSNGNTARIMFLVADAPPHDQDISSTINAVKDLRRKGIHIYPLASSGVADTAEFVMRIAAVTTHGRYLFLTDDSGIGNSHAEPHIPAYVVTTLKDLMVRIVDSEISGKRVEPREDQIIRQMGYLIEGRAVSKEELEEELQKQPDNITDDEVDPDDDETDPETGTPDEETDPASDDPGDDDGESSGEDGSPTGPISDDGDIPEVPETVMDPDPHEGSSGMKEDGTGSAPPSDRDLYGWDLEGDDDDGVGWGYGAPDICESEACDSGLPVFIFLFLLGIVAVAIIVIFVVVKKSKKNVEE
jgi:hypothetical protein